MKCIANRLLRGLAVLLAGGFLALAQAQPLQLKDDRGAELRLAGPPQRIISLLPSLTETVCALGACARLVGVDRWSNWPAEVKQLPRLGGLEDALLEPITRLKPDLVLASTSARALDRLEALGVPVLRLKSESHDDVRRTLELLARVLGQPERGAQVWATIQRDLDAAATRLPPAWRGQRVYFEVGGGPYAAGTQSFIGQTLTRLGLSNIVPASLGPFPKLNPEFVLRAQPDVIMGVGREAQGMGGRSGWSALSALQHRRQCGFATEVYEMMIRPGPRLGESALHLVDCLRGLPPPEARR
ncbi:MAG: ABC transporter substrate-binding protein [Burkholderiaceae bacterium]|nr:ABC transporter substrate-binding protein [Burkholderiaceae bacterium]